MQLDLKQLCQKYSGNLPRYTSYPTALEFKPIPSQDLVAALIAETFEKNKTYSYYLHLPFCPSLCYFCACHKIITQDSEVKSEYLKYVKFELQNLKGFQSHQNAVKQVHLGGGSPSYLTLTEFEKLNNDLQQSLPGYESAEKSIEIDPRTATPEKLKNYIQAGFKRVSLGVQDFDPNVQTLINRIQPIELTRSIYDIMRNLGVNGVNFDLIYGLPGQTNASLQATLAQVIQLRPDRIALYGYAHVNWKVKVQNVFNKYPLPDPQTRISMFAEAVNLLMAAGYEYIGLDHFALPNDELSLGLKAGRLRRTFMGYTTIAGEVQIANGVSGISDLNTSLLQNETDLIKYQEATAAGKIPVAKIIKRSSEDSIRAWAIEQLMCQRKLERNDLKKVIPDSSELAEQIFDQALNFLPDLVKDRLVNFTPERINVTEIGSFFLRNIAASFDEYFNSKNSPAKRFSQSI